MSQRNKLFVGGLSQSVTQDTLYEAFEKYGKIEDGEFKRPSCYCF
jgi:RNA recognition motif-containing protein